MTGSPTPVFSSGGRQHQTEPPAPQEAERSSEWSPLRSSGITRTDFRDRPARTFQDLRAEKRDLETAMLDLVASDPEKVAKMNRLLDALTLNGVDHTDRRTRPLLEKIRVLQAQLDGSDVLWLWRKSPDNAVRRAVHRIRDLISAADSGSTPRGGTVERAVAELYTACERLVDQRVNEQITERLAGDSVHPEARAESLPPGDGDGTGS